MHASNQPLWIGKDSVPHYNGDPKYGEEYAERALLGLDSCSNKDFQKAYASKLKKTPFQVEHGT